jgi:hypothetical protein
MLLGRRNSTFEHNIKTELKEILCQITDRIDLAQYMVQWWVLLDIKINFQVP